MFVELPDTSIADTSTEDLNTSVGSHGDSEKEELVDKHEELGDEKKINEGGAEQVKEAMEVRSTL